MRFEFATATRIIFGAGTLREAGALARDCGQRALLVTGRDTRRAQTLLARLREHDVTAVTFSVFREPDIQTVQLGVDTAKRQGCDHVIGFGGGSALDAGKAIAAMLTNEGELLDYLEVIGRANALSRASAPFIAIPTTAGTGSECQSYALVSRDDSHEKMACGDPKVRARIAILDPELTETQPNSVAVQTGLDALAHALESAVCTRRNPISALYSEAAFRHISAALGRVIAGQAGPEERGRMQLGAALAGLAIENSMLGAAHATANPLTARHQVVHGSAVALMLPHVMRFNAQEPAVRAIYDRYAGILAESGGTPPLIEWVAELVSQTAPPRIEAAEMQMVSLAEEAGRQWTAQFNPRPLQQADYVALYRRALDVHAA
jgi:alcohol dehydrogenase